MMLLVSELLRFERVLGLGEIVLGLGVVVVSQPCVSWVFVLGLCMVFVSGVDRDVAGRTQV